MLIWERTEHDFFRWDRLNARQDVSNGRSLITWKGAVPDSRLNGQCGTQSTPRVGTNGKNTFARRAGSREPFSGGNYRRCLFQTRPAWTQEAKGRIDSHEEIPDRRACHQTRNQGPFCALMGKKHVRKRQGPSPAPSRWGCWKAQIHPHERRVKAPRVTSRS
jgi:hypothetical protein